MRSDVFSPTSTVSRWKTCTAPAMATAAYMQAESSVRKISSALASRKNSALISSVTFTMGTNAVQALSSMVGRPTTPAGSATAM